MRFIYLSPHLDDAILSCGAIIRQQLHNRAEVEIWTLFAGDPPQGPLFSFAQELHTRWQTGDFAAQRRRAEDTLACERIGAKPVHFSFPDCIYRSIPGTNQPVIKNNDDLFQTLPAHQTQLIEEIVKLLAPSLHSTDGLVIPLSVGNHIDHQLTRRVGELLNTSPLYYADFPYAGDHPENVLKKVPAGFSACHYPLDNQSLSRWQYALEAYTSQISTFWPSIHAMYEVVENYAHSELGNCLWYAQD